MSKLLALTYSFLILFQSFNINLEDISKLSALLEHADYHKEMYGDTFFEFLAEHYGEATDDHENEHKEHEDLPFKDSHQLCSHTNTSFISPTIYFNLNYQEFKKIPFNFYYKDTFSSFEKYSIFQPPKHT